MQSSTFVFVIATTLVVTFSIDKTEGRMTMVQIKNALKGPAKKCAKNNNITPEISQQPYKGVMPDDHNLKCYFQCVLAAMKTCNKAGEVDKKETLKQVNSLMPLDVLDKSVEITEHCFKTAVTSKEICERAYQVVKCGWELAPEMYFLP